jgi:hypothetical protein
VRPSSRGERQPHGLALDGDAALALDVHPVEVLRAHRRSSTTPVSCSIRSASVDLPWSMWAMMQKLRITDGSVRCGTWADLSVFPDGTGGTQDPMLAGTTGGRPSSHARRMRWPGSRRAGMIER